MELIAGKDSLRNRASNVYPRNFKDNARKISGIFWEDSSAFGKDK